jgi:hypothetical protein
MNRLTLALVIVLMAMLCMVPISHAELSTEWIEGTLTDMDLKEQTIWANYSDEEGNEQTLSVTVGDDTVLNGFSSLDELEVGDWIDLTIEEDQTTGKSKLVILEVVQENEEQLSIPLSEADDSLDS